MYSYNTARYAHEWSANVWFAFGIASEDLYCAFGSMPVRTFVAVGRETSGDLRFAFGRETSGDF